MQFNRLADMCAEQQGMLETLRAQLAAALNQSRALAAEREAAVADKRLLVAQLRQSASENEDLQLRLARTSETLAITEERQGRRADELERSLSDTQEKYHAVVASDGSRASELDRTSRWLSECRHDLAICKEGLRMSHDEAVRLRDDLATCRSERDRSLQREADISADVKRYIADLSHSVEDAARRANQATARAELAEANHTASVGTVKRLESTLAAAASQHDGCLEQIGQLQVTIRDRDDAIASQRLALCDAERRADDALRRIHELTDAIGAAGAKQDDWRRQMDDERDRARRLHASLQDSVLQCASLREELKSAESAKASLEVECKEQIDALRYALSKAQSDLKQHATDVDGVLANQLSLLQQRVDDLSSDAKMTAVELNSTRGFLVKVTSERDYLAEQVASLQQQLSEEQLSAMSREDNLNQSIRERYLEHDKECRDLDTHTKQLHTELRVALASLAESESQHAEATARADSAEMHAANLGGELQQALEWLTADRQRAKDAVAENVALKERNAEQIEHIDRLKTRCLALANAAKAANERRKAHQLMAEERQQSSELRAASGRRDRRSSTPNARLLLASVPATPYDVSMASVAPVDPHARMPTVDAENHRRATNDSLADAVLNSILIGEECAAHSSVLPHRPDISVASVRSCAPPLPATQPSARWRELCSQKRQLEERLAVAEGEVVKLKAMLNQSRKSERQTAETLRETLLESERLKDDRSNMVQQQQREALDAARCSETRRIEECASLSRQLDTATARLQQATDRETLSRQMVTSLNHEIASTKERITQLEEKRHYWEGVALTLRDKVVSTFERINAAAGRHAEERKAQWGETTRTMHQVAEWLEGARRSLADAVAENHEDTRRSAMSVEQYTDLLRREQQNAATATASRLHPPCVPGGHVSRSSVMLSEWEQVLLEYDALVMLGASDGRNLSDIATDGDITGASRPADPPNVTSTPVVTLSPQTVNYLWSVFAEVARLVRALIDGPPTPPRPSAQEPFMATVPEELLSQLDESKRWGGPDISAVPTGHSHVESRVGPGVGTDGNASLDHSVVCESIVLSAEGGPDLNQHAGLNSSAVDHRRPAASPVGARLPK